MYSLDGCYAYIAVMSTLNPHLSSRSSQPDFNAQSENQVCVCVRIVSRS